MVTVVRHCRCVLFHIAVETSISPQTVTMGDTVTFTCTSLLGPAMIQWEDRDNEDMVLEMTSEDMVLEMTSGMQTELALELGPVSQSMNGGRYIVFVVAESPFTNPCMLGKP